MRWTGALILLAVLAACSGPEFAGPLTVTPSDQSNTAAPTAQQPQTITSTLPPTTISAPPTTIVVTATEPTLIPPPPSTKEPAPKTGDCPYLSSAFVRDANGQNVGRIATITVKPAPICLFYRPDGTIMAVTRIIKAATPEEATAAVNDHVPISDSFEVDKPFGWTGGAMALPAGTVDYPDVRSIYAVAKDRIAVIAMSNQAQSVKGRQMAIEIIANLGL